MEFIYDSADSTWMYNNVFLSKLQSNTITISQFTKSQASFVNCVNYWSQILGKLVFMLDDYHSRRKVIENLNDEHGLLHDGQAHVDSFKLFITTLGGKVPTAAHYDEPSHNFNHSLLIASNTQCPVFIATLGFIEYYYQKISGIIINYLKANNVNNNIHYSEHELLDIKHYTDLFSLLDTYTDVTKKHAMLIGAELAMHAFDNYYTQCFDLYCMPC